MKAYTSVNPNLEEILNALKRLEETIFKFPSYMKAVGKRVYMALKAIYEFVKQKIAELICAQEQTSTTFSNTAELVDALEAEHPDLYQRGSIMIIIAYNNGAKTQVSAELYISALKRFDRYVITEIVRTIEESRSPDRVLRSIKDKLNKIGAACTKWTTQIMRVIEGHVK